MMTCNTCCRPVASPFRSYDAAGKITAGCVSAAHDGQLLAISETNRWHNRPQAKALRRAERARGAAVAA